MERSQHDAGRGGGANLMGELPQWNNKLSFSAQSKQPGAAPPGTAGAGSSTCPRRTPGLGEPRRVPVAAGGGAAAAASPAAAQARAAAPHAAGRHAAPAAEPDKTPTLCLFERFERLSLVGATPATRPTQAAAAAAGSSTSAGAGAPQAGRSATTAATTAGAASGSRQPGDDAARARQGRRSVAFGTPSVLTYTPASPATPDADANDDGDADGASPLREQQQAGDETPLWSNAGHTPYSLPGSSAAGGGGIRELEGSDDDDEGAAADGGDNQHDGGMVLVTSAIHAVPGLDAEHTPAGAGRLLRCPRTPATALHGTLLAAVAEDEAAAAAADGSHSTPMLPRGAHADAAAAAASSSGGGADVPSTPQVQHHHHELLLPGGMRLPAVTPKSKLRMPERVALGGATPSVPKELRQLLGDPDAAAAAAAAAAHQGPCAADAAAAGGGGLELLGSRATLSPVRARKTVQQALQAGAQVLTPVRRSARKAAAAHSKVGAAASTSVLAGGATPARAPAAAAVQPMLEATNYCYQPNDAMK